MSQLPFDRCLITGGAGFIGSHIATHLVEQGCHVRVLDNFCTGSRDNLSHLGHRVEIIDGDVEDAEAVEDAVAGMQVVFHQAALASVPLSIKEPLRTHATCVTGTVNVLDASRRLGVKRVVYAGSSSAYGNSPQMPKRESHTPEVLSPYAAAKLAGEYYCQSFARSYDLEVVRLRYFNVFGPRQDPKSPYSAVIPLFAAALLDGRDPVVYGSGEQSRDFVHVSNVVSANVLAASVPKVSGRVYNVASGSSISVLELLRLICDFLGKRFTPEFRPPREGDVLYSSADISAATRDLGYVARVGLWEGLRETLNFYRQERLRQAAEV